MITKDMTIGEILRVKPESAQVLMDMGMGCKTRKSNRSVK